MKYGINISGGEGPTADERGNQLPYQFAHLWQLEYYAAKGFTQVRIPIAWELAQPTLNGALAQTYLAELRRVVTQADALGLEVVIDVHNYGAYNGKLIGTPEVPVSAFADLWGKLATTFAGADNVVFGLMNEPQQATAAEWLVAINAAIGAIRTAGATQQITVSGAYWDGAWSWTISDNATVIGAPGKVVDPLGNFVIEVHQYLDDTSGQNSWVVSETIGVERLQAITAWARSTGAKLYMGEYGVADNAPALAAMSKMLAYMQANGDVWVGSAYWGGGAFGRNYIFSSEPILGIIDAAQVDVLETFIATSGVANPLSSRIVDTFDTAGHLVSRILSDAAGIPTRSLARDADGKTTITNYYEDGRLQWARVYDANQVRIGETTRAVDGSYVVKTYLPGAWDPYLESYHNASGIRLYTVEHSADGHLATNFAANGRITSVELYSPEWRLVSRDSYDAAGARTSRQVDNVDGTHVVMQYDSVSGFATASTHYNASWKAIGRTTYAAGGVPVATEHYVIDNSHDPKVGGAEVDAFFFFGRMTSADRVSGGAGDDILALQGNYAAGLTFGVNAMVDVETLSILTGSDARFGDTANARYSYNLTTVDGNVAAGRQLIVNAAVLLATENLTFDGSAERDGTFFIYAGRGVDVLTGGAQADVFFFAEQRFGASDRVVGGAGDDNLVLRGNYSGADRIVLAPDAISGVETISLLSASDTRFFAGGTTYSYDLTTPDSLVTAGATLTINGARLTAAETVTINAAAETNGHLRLFGGSGADVIKAGAGNDLLYGGLGADRLEGGAGSDRYQYKAVAESTGRAFDQIVGFDATQDVIDLPGTVSGWGQRVTAGAVSSATFDTDLARAVDASLQSNGAVLFQASGGDLAGRIFAVVDADGNGVYTAGNDFVIEFVNPLSVIDQSIGIFV